MARQLRAAGLFGLFGILLIGSGCAPLQLQKEDKSQKPCTAVRPDAHLQYLGEEAKRKGQLPAGSASQPLFLPERLEGPPVENPAPAPQPHAVRGQSPEAPPLPPTIKQTSHLAPTPELPTHRVRICAWVDGKPLFESELYGLASAELIYASQLPEPERSVKRHEILKERLKDLIDQEVMLQDAYKKLETNPQFLDKMKAMARKQFHQRMDKMRREKGLSEFEFKKSLEMQGTTLEALQRHIERQFIVSQYMQSRVMPILDKVGHKEIREYYETHGNEFQTVDRVEWEDIFVLVGGKNAPTLEQARQLAKYVAHRLAVGDPITALMQYDDGDSTTRKGRGYGERRGEIKPPELEKYLFQMKPGQVGPPVELATGIHVFRLVQREYARQLPFNEEVQTKIRTKLKNDIFQREFDRIVRQLAGKTVIEIDPNVLQ